MSIDAFNATAAFNQFFQQGGSDGFTYERVMQAGTAFLNFMNSEGFQATLLEQMQRFGAVASERFERGEYDAVMHEMSSALMMIAITFAVLVFVGFILFAVYCFWSLGRAKRLTGSYQVPLLICLAVLFGVVPQFFLFPMMFHYIVGLKGEIRDLRREAANNDDDNE